MPIAAIISCPTPKHAGSTSPSRFTRLPFSLPISGPKPARAAIVSSSIFGRAILSGEAMKPSGLRAGDGEPNCAEPWQAQVMAIAANLVDAGHFTAVDWSASLADEIRRAKAAGEPDSADSYYLCALLTLEQLAKSRGILKADDLAE